MILSLIQWYKRHVNVTDTGQLYHMNFSSMMLSLQHHVISNKMVSTKPVQTLNNYRAGLTFYSYGKLRADYH